MTEKNSRKSYFFAFLTVIMWSTVATSFKVGLEFLSPANLLFYSSLTSLILFIAIFIFKSEKNELFTAKNILNSAIFGFLNPFLYYLILFEAYKLLPAQIAQPLNYTWVIVVTILMSVFFKQKLGLISIVGLLVSFFGVIILSTQGNISGYGEISLWGIILALSSSIFWGFYWLLNLRDKRDDISKLLLNFASGTAFILIYILITENIQFSFYGLYSGIYIGLFEMGLTFFVWLQALKYAENTAKTGSIIYLSPFISLLFISLILKESISISSIVGLFFVIFGIIITKFFEIFKKREI